MTQKELSEELGIGLSTLKKYRSLGMDIKASVDDCKNWIAQHSALSGKGGGLDVGGHTFTAQEVIDIKARYYLALEQKTKSQADLNDLKLKLENKELVPASDLENALDTILKPLKQSLDNMAYKICGQCNEQKPSIAKEAIENEIQLIYQNLQTSLNESINKEGDWNFQA